MTVSPISTMARRKRRWILVLLATISLATVCQAAEQLRMRTWTDDSGKFKTEAALLDFSAGKVKLQKADGKVITITMSKLCEADREYVLANRPAKSTKKNAVKEPTKKGPSNEADFGNLLGEDTPTMPSAEPIVREAVVTGVGVDAEKAEQDAFRRAIEQTVGVLVDAETIVENDEIIKDQVLTFSRAYVQEYDVVKRWQENELHQVTIRASVSVTKLAEKLEANNVTVRKIPGMTWYRQAKEEIGNEKDAAKMFTKAFADYRMENLWVVESSGKPELVDQDDTHARVKIGVRVRADGKKWDTFAAGVLPLLETLALKRSVATYSIGRGRVPRLHSPTPAQMEERLSGDGIRIAVVKAVNRTGTLMEVSAFLLPETVEGTVVDAGARTYRLVHSLVDSSDTVVKSIRQDIAYRYGATVRPYRPVHQATLIRRRGPDNCTWFGPFLWSEYAGSYATQDFEIVIECTLEELRRIDKCATGLEEIVKEGNLESPSSPFSSGMGSAFGQPGSGMGQPGSGMGQPGSGMGQPGSAMGQNKLE